MVNERRLLDDEATPPESMKVDLPTAPPGQKAGMPLALKIALGIAGGGVLLVFVCCGGCALLRGMGSANSDRDVHPDPMSGVVQVTAEDLFAAYERDKAAADVTYTGKELVVTGLVANTYFDDTWSDLSKDSALVFSRAGSADWGVLCMFDTAPPASRRPSTHPQVGSRVKLVGKCKGMSRAFEFSVVQIDAWGFTE